MKTVNPLSDGQPLTYDWLNTLATAIENVQKNQKSDGAKVKFFTKTGDTKSTIQFLSGQHTTTIKNGVGELKVSFGKVFSSNVGLLVFAQINSTASTDFSALLTPTEITTSGCLIKVKQYGKASDKSQSVNISYFAMGPTTS